MPPPRPTPWDGDIDLSLETATRVIRAGAPGLDVRDVRVLAEGWDCRAFEVDGEWVFRFIKRRAEAAYMEREVRLLRFLRGRVPVAIPEVAYHGEGWMAYRKLNGTWASEGQSDSSVAREIGRFLKVLHGIQASDVGAVGLVAAPRRPARMRERAQGAVAAARTVLTEEEQRWVDGFVSGEPPAAWEGEARLVHNDLHLNHVLLEDGRVAGVIDWTDAALGDPAADFAGLAYRGGVELACEALREYGVVDGAGIIERARYVATCIAILDIGYGVETGRMKYADWGRAALRVAYAKGD